MMSLVYKVGLYFLDNFQISILVKSDYDVRLCHEQSKHTLLEINVWIILQSGENIGHQT